MGEPWIPHHQVELRARCLPATGGAAEWSDTDLEGSVVERLARQVGRHGDRIAVDRGSRPLTYLDLQVRASRVAGAVLDRAGPRPGPVLHLFERPAEAVEALFGILEAGGVYVPLDARLPAERLRRIASDTGARLLLLDQSTEVVAREVVDPGVAWLRADEAFERAHDPRPGPTVGADDLAWIVYTSGSTGAPKGVMQTHRNVLLHAARYTRAFGVGPRDRISNLFSLATHAGLFNLFLPLLDGAASLPFDLREHGLHGLAAWMADAGVTVSCMVPTVFRELAGGLPPAAVGSAPRLESLRLVFLAGEPTLRSDFELYRRRLPTGCLLVNRLGSTETDCIRLFFADHDSEITSATVPVGYAVPEAEVVLLDEAGDRVAAGEAGEIVVTGGYLSPGYWRDPELTAAVFTARGGDRTYRTGDVGRMAPDGCLEYLGRRDHQVKIRGYRVEPAEIEGALLGLAGIANAAVAAHVLPPGDTRLVAYVVMDGECTFDPAGLRTALAERLPSYMVPSAFVELDRLPRTPNGKVDRRRLPPPDDLVSTGTAPYRAPRTDLERAVAAIWAEVLGLDRVGLDDDFLDLGGTSIASMRILGRINGQLDLDLSMGDVLRCLTASDLVRLIEHRGL